MFKPLGGAVALGVVALSASSVLADDWHRWRGPDLNGISRETGWFKPWPKEGPRQLWKANVGPGYSTVSVAKGRLYTCGSENKKETITCLDSETGKLVWQHTYATAFKPEYYEGGSSGTPTIDGDRVYHLGQMGELFCFEAASGKVIWSNNVAKATDSKIPTWGLTGAPLVSRDTIILNVGDAGAAVDKATGRVLWRSSGEGGYATPVPFHDDFLIFGTKSLACVNGKDGSLQWRHPWETRYDVNAADPIVISDKRILISSDYDHGSALLEAKGKTVKELWQNKNMRNPFASSIVIDGFAYGIDAYAGKPNGTLRCIEVATGELKWQEASVGNGALMAAEKKLIVISERGELMIVDPTPTAFKTIARAQVIGGKCWTMPVLSNGKIYSRNSKGDLVCVSASGM